MQLARTFISVPAGHARVPLARFTVLTTLGCAIWASGFTLTGMLLGASWQHAGHALRIPLLLRASCGRRHPAESSKPKSSLRPHRRACAVIRNRPVVRAPSEQLSTWHLWRR